MKIYLLERKKVVFNRMALYEEFNKCKRRKSVTRDELERTISEELFISQSTVDNWIRGKNAPDNLKIVERLAEALGLTDYKILLLEFKEEPLPTLNDRQKSAAKRIYDACVDIIGDVLYDKECEITGPETAKKIKKLSVVCDQEYFDLKDTEIYNELCEAALELMNISAMNREDASDLCDETMLRLNTILDRYI